jgi:hypothetical protein
MSVTKVTGMMQTGTKGGDISSASPTVVDTDGDYFDITGTTNFAAFTVVAGRRFTAQFDGVLTMTHHATNLDLPGGANITTAAGDVAEFFATGTNTVQCMSYTRADGTPIALSNNSVTLAKMAGGTDGQIITYDASGDPVAVGPGTDGQVLTSTGSGSPPAFEAAAGGGKLLQVVSTNKTDNVSTTSATYEDSGLQVIITPAATSSKIFLLITLGAVGVQTVEARVYFQLTGGNTASYIGDAGTGHEAAFSWTPRGGDAYGMTTIVGSYLDSPSTTSAVTYKLQWKSSSASSSAWTMNKPYTLDAGGSNNASTMTAFEIGA